MSQVWYVQGEVTPEEWPALFATKMDAEVYARTLFPEEGEDRRYARIYCREVHKFVADRATAPKANCWPGLGRMPELKIVEA